MSSKIKDQYRTNRDDPCARCNKHAPGCKSTCAEHVAYAILQVPKLEERKRQQQLAMNLRGMEEHRYRR